MRVSNVIAVIVLLIGLGITAVYYYQTIIFNPPLHELLIVGGITNTSAIIWVRSTNSSKVTIQYTSLKSLEPLNQWITSDEYELKHENEYIVAIQLHNLQPEERYAVRAIFDHKKTTADIFQTFPTNPIYKSQTSNHSQQKKHQNHNQDEHQHEESQQNDEKKNTTSIEIVFGSCMAVTIYPFNELQVFSEIMHEGHPTFALILGDLIYSDIHKEIPYRVPFDVAYHQVLGDKHLSRFLKVIPTYTMIDDHEIENDFDRGNSDPLASNALHYYHLYFGSRNPLPSILNDHHNNNNDHISSNINNDSNDDDKESGKEERRMFSEVRRREEIFYTIEYGEVEVFVIDTRTKRDQIEEIDSKNKTMLGYYQKEKLKEWLRSSTAKLKIIASPVSWSSVGDGEFYRYERAEIFSFIEQNNICNVIILSGDLHWGAAYQYSPHLFEFTASPFQALPFPAPSEHQHYFDHISELEKQNTQRVFNLHQTNLFFSSFKFHFGRLKIEEEMRRISVFIYSLPVFYKLVDAKPKIDFEFHLKFENECLTAINL